ncbi:glycosyltransferase [soil metagenome]
MARILHVTECFAGGVSRAIKQIAAVTPQHEHHLLWTGDEAPTSTQGFASMSELPQSPIGRIQSVRQVTSELSADIVHAHSSWAGVYARATKLPAYTIYQPHCYAFEDVQRSPVVNYLYYLAEKQLAKHSDLTIALTEHERSLTRRLSSKARVEILPNVASLRPDEPRIRKRVPLERISVVMVGRLCRQKDPAYFVRVANKIRETLPELRFKWIGDGEAKMRAHLETNNIEVTGWMSALELAEHLKEDGLYFHCAAHEAFPLSILDAAAFGLPIVARKIPAFDGFDLLMGSTEAECAGLVLTMLGYDDSWSSAIAASSKIDEEMSPKHQAERLNYIYETAGG